MYPFFDRVCWLNRCALPCPSLTHGHALIITIKNYGTFEIEIDPKMLRCLCMEAVRSGLAAKGALAVGFRNAS